MLDPDKEVGMAETTGNMSTGTATVLNEPAIEAFAAALRGPLLRPDDEGYDAARATWNAMIDRRPALIARCVGAADVVRSVAFARDQGLMVSVRGGGHNVAGNAVCGGGLMIDLSPMKSIRIDPVARTARVEPGVTWAEFDAEAQAFGLATTGGIIPTTGVAGLTLGGGLGWLMGKHGLSADNLLAADVVTADGNLINASEGANADLFWGLRGGGGNFGIVTSFEFRLHPVSELLGGILVHPLERSHEVLAFYRDYVENAPDELSTMIAFVTTPDGTRVCAIVVCYNGPVAEGEQVLRPLREFGPPLADEVGPISYSQMQDMFTAAFPPGLQNYWKSNFLNGLDDEAVQIIAGNFAQAPSSMTSIAIERIGGAVCRVGRDDTAFNHRDAGFNLLILGIWPDPQENDANIGWVRELWEAVQPFSSEGVYVNYLGEEADEGRERILSAYGAEKHERLVALKRKYDPGNLFRLNQNIRP